MLQPATTLRQCRGTGSKALGLLAVTPAPGSPAGKQLAKAVTRGVFWVFEHPPKFQGKIRHTKTDLLLVTKFARGVEPTVSRFVVKTVFMPSTSLEMHQNQFRPGLPPGPHWGSLQRFLRPLAGGEGARRVLPKNPTPSSALRASAIQAMLCRPPTIDGEAGGGGHRPPNDGVRAPCTLGPQL